MSPEPLERRLGAIGTPGSHLEAFPGCLGTLPLAVLDGNVEDLLEGFLAPGTVTTRHHADECLARAEGWLFGSIPLDETHGLTQGTETAYRQLFARLHGENTPHLWRVWHYIPAINAIDTTTGLERYRLFNQGRANAFEWAKQGPARSAPAACALGSPSGTTGRVIYLAADTPAERIENPRQVSAWDYPERYGPKSPLFARAALARGKRHDWLFISGTASIVGHETRHHGDVATQTQETIANLEAVLREANGKRRQGERPFAWDAAGLLRIYLRHPEHLSLVREQIDDLLDRRASRVYLQADICREDLLVEIEATLRQPRHGAEASRDTWPEL
ncbi:chorismate transformation enzyme, FkbO/Hyg5 family [Guyparkeria halopsychrophila]|uniref:chorismate transformation enzyme, FkbO/Hyg5 family n=1 Tax=Guyparkeria halopsychrophila TaxID=3139421 RepID=UPI0037CA38C1